MTAIDLSSKRVLVTQSASFMGPALCEVFAEMRRLGRAIMHPLTESHI
jgi:hypothetical protein